MLMFLEMKFAYLLGTAYRIKVKIDHKTKQVFLRK